MRHAHDRLGCKMEYRLDLVFAERPAEQGRVLELSPDDGDPAVEAALEQVRFGHEVAHEADDSCACLDERIGQPASQEPGTAGDEDSSVLPEIRSRRFRGIGSHDFPPDGSTAVFSRLCQGATPS
jgi:hypothetical protein